MIVILVTLSYGIVEFAEHQHGMALMPADLEVTRILYRNEEKWESVLLPLPGDNETGILMYGLPDAVVNRIKAEGLSFFDRPENVAQRVGRKRSHSERHETPIAEGDQAWPIER